MHKKAFLSFLIPVLAACSAHSAEPTYIVTAHFDADDDDSMAYIIDYDNSEKLDSALVTDGKAVFSKTIEQPRLARLLLNGARKGTFVLEQGNINIENGNAEGGKLNGVLSAFDKQMSDLNAEFVALPDSLKAQKGPEFAARAEAMQQKLATDNIDNPIGYYFFLNQAYDYTLDELDAAIAKTPSLGQYKRIANLRTALVNKAATSEGAMFKDFAIEVTADSTVRLSDYVGKGKYVLTDFWASWCGPCMRESVVIKEIYNKYHEKGLEVLGVAVWDEPQNTLNTIEKKGFPWPNIINAQSVPTDLYGISGIPCIILYGPDGKIVSRDKRGDELKAVIAEIYDNN